MFARWKYAVSAIALSVFVVVGCAELEQYNIYWGDVHGHTDISDGKGDLDDYFIHARDVSLLDFAMVTDHDFGNAPPWWLSVETWRNVQEKADEYTEDGRFIAIAGYEWTSEPKFWDYTDEEGNREAIFEGPPKFYNHKNVYFPSPGADIFRAKDASYNSPDLLAEAVKGKGGLIQNNHPTPGLAGRDQWDYELDNCSVITNTEMRADIIFYKGEKHRTDMESLVRGYLDQGGVTGFVGGTDTHDGMPAARTAVFATELTREAIFEALSHHRNYAVSNAKIILDFRINEHYMGEEIEIDGKPLIYVAVVGTDKIKEVAIIKNGSTLISISRGKKKEKFEYVDDSFEGNSYYYLRVTQFDVDEFGNPSCAWSSPIWVKKKE
ncbi:MAG: CehA/McbA family metallohydrolase [Planctomycetota bacterium]|jgi:hypothetical protein